MRTFLALPLPGDLREWLAGARRSLAASCPGWRWVRSESIHLTLRFLGEVEPDRPALERETWRVAVEEAGPVRFRLDRLGTFPERGRPRVLWLGLRDSGTEATLAQLAGAVETAARRLGYPHEERPFRPHLTLARAKRGTRAALPDPSFPVPPIEVGIDTLVLFRSRLGSDGASYTRLESFPLAG